MAKQRSEIFSHHTYDLIRKKDERIKELEDEVTRLKSWEHFTSTLSMLQTFSKLSEENQQMILLMMDGMKYRKEQHETSNHSN